MTKEEKMKLVNDYGQKALENGEVPVAAIIFRGDEILVKAFTTEKSDGRFLVHAEQKALLEVDKMNLSIKERNSLELYTNLEPCMMCLGMSISSFIGTIVYSLDAGSDGAVNWASDTWDKYHPGSFFSMPKVINNVSKSETINLFKSYISKYKRGTYVEWVKELVHDYRTS